MKRAPPKLSFDGVGKRDRKVVVTLARFKWKQRHGAATEHMIRMVRFVWMRAPVLWSSRDRLHAGILGRCMSAGLLAQDGPRLVVTTEGDALLLIDRKDHARMRAEKVEAHAT